MPSCLHRALNLATWPNDEPSSLISTDVLGTSSPQRPSDRVGQIPGLAGCPILLRFTSRFSWTLARLDPSHVGHHGVHPKDPRRYPDPLDSEYRMWVWLVWVAARVCHSSSSHGIRGESELVGLSSCHTIYDPVEFHWTRSSATFAFWERLALLLLQQPRVLSSVFEALPRLLSYSRRTDWWPTTLRTRTLRFASRKWIGVGFARKPRDQCQEQGCDCHLSTKARHETEPGILSTDDNVNKIELEQAVLRLKETWKKVIVQTRRNVSSYSQ